MSFEHIAALVANQVDPSPQFATYARLYPRLLLTSWQPSSSGARSAYSKFRTGILKLGAALAGNPIIWMGDEAQHAWALYPYGWSVAVPRSNGITVYSEAVPSVATVVEGSKSASAALGWFWKERGDTPRAAQQQELEQEARAILASASVPDPIALLRGKLRDLGQNDSIENARQQFAATLGLSAVEANAAALSKGTAMPTLSSRHSGNLFRLMQPGPNLDRAAFRVSAPTEQAPPTAPSSSAPLVGGGLGVVAGAAAGYFLGGRSLAFAALGAAAGGGAGYLGGTFAAK